MLEIFIQISIMVHCGSSLYSKYYVIEAKINENILLNKPQLYRVSSSLS